MAMIFKSKNRPGVLMNRYGTVIEDDRIIHSTGLRDAVRQEAQEAGWRLVRSDNADEGLVWEPPRKD